MQHRQPSGEIVSADFFDHVSGQVGPAIWSVVAEWSAKSFADVDVQIHEIMTAKIESLVWFTVTGHHIGDGFPRLGAFRSPVSAFRGHRSISFALPMNVWSSTGLSAMTTRSLKPLPADRSQVPGWYPSRRPKPSELGADWSPRRAIPDAEPGNVVRDARSSRSFAGTFGAEQPSGGPDGRRDLEHSPSRAMSGGQLVRARDWLAVHTR